MRFVTRLALENPELLTYEVVARALKVAMSTLRGAVDAGEIRATEAGRFRRISKAELRRLLARRIGEEDRPR